MNKKPLSDMTDEEFHEQHVKWMCEAEDARKARYAEMNRIIAKIDRQIEEDRNEEAKRKK
jgi:hypothetical protein